MAHTITDDVLTAALAAVSDACAVCRHVQIKLDDIKAMSKDDKSPVTIADYASQAIVSQQLRIRLGVHSIVGEESASALRSAENTVQREQVLDAVRLAWPGAAENEVLDAIDAGHADPKNDNAFWTLDPIDGTKGFLRNNQYAIALAYVVDGEPVLGVLGCPNLSASFDASFDEPDRTGSIYYAIKGKGTFQITGTDIRERGERVSATSRDDGTLSVCASVEKAHSNVSDTDRIMDHIASDMNTTWKPVRLDSQCKYAVVARGQSNAYLRLPTKKGYVERIWDHAAGALVATEAGAIVTDVHGKPLDFSHGRGLEQNRGVACATPNIHARVIDAIKSLNVCQIA
ncbi:MAG: 3'(2'),5'-bisphosphate nucleotidase [Phycisphaeraceae bacterium]|nr:3'(2'),5'-bisphosphate nucleotidase [Phycisphaerales bacterium]MCB9859417.1 3'(2'),5'-bisphosphate nucleotidase [Phycisphaeraceae bacterium]